MNGVAQLPKLRVAGSIPVSRSSFSQCPRSLNAPMPGASSLPLQLAVAQWLQSPFLDDSEKVNQTQGVGPAKPQDCSCRRQVVGLGSPVLEIFACKTSTWRIGIAFALEVRDSTLLPLTLKRK